MTEYISEFFYQVIDFVISEEISNFGESLKDQFSELMIDKLDSNNIFKKIGDKEFDTKNECNLNDLTLELISYYYN